VKWPERPPKLTAAPTPHHRGLPLTMLLITVPALLAVAVLRPGSSAYRRAR
jgi:hypothetical protein